jgi:GrpB-like predicted nucleotidyltransferase (UPF0157 family)
MPYNPSISIHERRPLPIYPSAAPTTTLTKIEPVGLIEHAGSTSIQGMIAKPTLDIAVLVSSFKVIDEAPKAKLASLRSDYVHKPEFPTRLFFGSGAWDAGTHHLHIFEEGSLEWSRMIAFRDFLRDNPKEHEE